MTTLSTYADLFLVEFKNSANISEITTIEHIHEPLKKLNNGFYLKDIYRFNNSKKKFEILPKNKYNMFFGWNTEAMVILENLNLIK
jgi:hypothetical protein